MVLKASTHLLRPPFDVVAPPTENLPGAAALPTFFLRWFRDAHSALGPLRRRAFAKIFDSDAWNFGGTLAASNTTRAGPGSGVQYTARVRSFLGDFMQSHNISSVADMSCSELLWQPLIPGFAKLKYFAGFDIVPSAVERARERVEALRKSGALLPESVDLADRDMVAEPLAIAVDLVIVRDTFFHLPLTDILVALGHINASGSRFLGTTTIEIDATRNAFILPGEWYALNIRKPPFLFPAPLASTLEGEPGSDLYGSKLFGIWPLPLVMQSPE